MLQIAKFYSASAGFTNVQIFPVKNCLILFCNSSTKANHHPQLLCRHVLKRMTLNSCHVTFNVEYSTLVIQIACRLLLCLIVKIAAVYVYLVAHKTTIKQFKASVKDLDNRGWQQSIRLHRILKKYLEMLTI